MASDFLRETGEKIKKARKERKLSQKQLAEIIECSPQLISKIEKGQVDTTISTLLAIQRTLGLKKGLIEDNFFEILIEWAKESGGSENIGWFKNQIEKAFPMFKKWKDVREEGGDLENEAPASKVA